MFKRIKKLNANGDKGENDSENDDNDMNYKSSDYIFDRLDNYR